MVDVKAASKLADPGVQARFSWIRRLAALRGWGFEAWSGEDQRLLPDADLDLAADAASRIPVTAEPAWASPSTVRDSATGRTGAGRHWPRGPGQPATIALNTRS